MTNKSENQIAAQVMGLTDITVLLGSGHPESMALVHDEHGHGLIPPMSKRHALTESEYTDIKAMLADERKFNTDPLTLRFETDAQYDAFFDKYYNGRK